MITLSFSDVYDWLIEEKYWYYQDFNYDKNNNNLAFNFIEQLPKNIKKIFIIFQIGDNVSLYDIEIIIDKITNVNKDRSCMFGAIINRRSDEIEVNMYYI